MKIDKVMNKYIENNIHKQKDNSDKNTNIIEQKDKAEISSSAKSLVKKINQSENSTYSEKVERIRQSVQQGKYKVSSEKIADTILQEMEFQNKSGDY